jgi:hypothetical protein
MVLAPASSDESRTKLLNSLMLELKLKKYSLSVL